MDATIIAASLNSDELKKSIDSLVNYVKTGMGQIKSSVDSAVEGMQKSFNFKMDSSGGTSRVAKQQREVTQAVKETEVAYDQLAQAQQKATAPKSARDSYLAFMQGYKQQAQQIQQQINSWESLLLQRQIGRIKEIDAQIARINQRVKEAELTSSPNRGQIIADARAKADAEIAQLRQLQQQLNNNPLMGQDTSYLDKLREKYDNVLGILRDIGSTSRQNEQAQQGQIQSAKQYSEEERKRTEEIKRQAEEIRKSKSFQEKGFYTYTVGDTDYIIHAKSKVSIEEQLLRVKQDVARQQEIQSQNEARIKFETQGSVETARQQLSVEQQITEARSKRRYNTAMMGETDITSSKMASFLSQQLRIDKTQVVQWDEQTNSISRLQRALKQYQDAYTSMSASMRQSPYGKQMVVDMQTLERAIQSARREMSRPFNLASILNQPINTIDQLTDRLRQLETYKRGLNFNTQKQEIKDVDKALKDTRDRLNEYMNTGRRVGELNNALARSWNYMKNRLAFYFTVGASTQFVKQLAEVRGEYEMTERALGVLVDSAQKGTQIFNELSQMALISPYTLIELSSAARQLTAYGVAAKDVVETTRRVADMAAAVGAPIERLTYALGHVQTYGYLTSLQARQFINAGIPIVKELSNLYTQMEGRMVSVADVYDRMKKKAVSYNDVMQVVNQMTDEGGRFFNFQAKMADTLKVQLANLDLAYKNMLNDIGKSTQGPIVGVIKGLKELFLRWKDINGVIRSLAIGFGVVKVAQILYINYTTKVGLATAAADVASKKMVATLYTMKGAFTSLMTSPLTWWTVLVSAVVSAGMAFYNANERVKEFNQSLRDNAKENKKNIEEFISANDIATKVGSNLTGQDELEKMWDSIREQIELTSASSEELVKRLSSIGDVRERVSAGLSVLQDIMAVNSAMEEMGDKAISIKQELAGWWNLWLLPDGLVENLRDYQEAVDDTESSWAKFIKTYALSYIAPAYSPLFIKDATKDTEEHIEQLREDLKETTDSVINFIELKGWSGDVTKITEVFNKVREKILEQGQLDPQQAYTLQLLLEEARSEAAKKAQAQRLNDLNAAYKAETDDEVKYSILAEWNKQKEIYDNWESYNGRSKVEWERFTKWLKEQHIAETTAMFRNMDSEQIMSLNFQSGEYGKFVNKMVTKYAQEHKMSYDEAFNYLRTWITSANQWSIFIPLIIGTQEKSVEQQLGEYDATIDKADATIKRLTTRINELREKQKLSYEEQKELDKAERERADAEKAKAEAESKGGHGKQEAKDAKKAEKEAAKARRQSESELQKALKEELSLIDQIRNAYKSLTKQGESRPNAIYRAVDGYEETIERINNVLRKYGVEKFDATKFAGINNPRELVSLLQVQLNTLVASGLVKTSEVKDLQVKINKLNLDARTFDLEAITKGLNNELDKIKEEYELAVELDANPELGNMFTEMFGINTDDLPRTFADAYDKANQVAKDKLKELGHDLEDFDLLSANINPDAENNWLGMAFDSNAVQGFIKSQNTWRDIFKKNVTETEKMLDDYVKKYGDYSDKVAEIESDRLTRLRELNNAYFTEELKQLPEYIAKYNAIQTGAQREKSNARFDMFKESRYYTMMFENLDYISTQTIRDMRNRLRGLMNDMNTLTPEQLKQVITQYEKLEQKLAKRSPFRTFGKDFSEYLSTRKERKTANENFRNAQKEYDAQIEIVAATKEKLEVMKDAHQTHTSDYLSLLQELGVQQDNLDILKERLDNAEKIASKYNLIKSTAQREAAALANTVATNLQSLGEMRDFIQDGLGIELGKDLNAAVDGLVAVGGGINKIVSSATSGDVVGMIVGVGESVKGVVDAFGGIFGGGLVDTYTPFVESMERLVDALNTINDRLRQTLEQNIGAEAVSYYDKLVKNNERIERQYMEAARMYGESGSSTWTHSHAWDVNERIRGYASEISAVAGQEVNVIQDFYNLSSKQLEDIMLGLPHVWALIDEEQRQWFEKIIEMQDQAKEDAESLARALTNIDLSTLTGDFESLLGDLSNSMEDFGDNIEETLRNAILRGLMVKTYAGELEQWQQQFNKFMEDGVLSKEEAEGLREWYMDIASRARNDFNAQLDAAGVEATSSESKSLSNLQQGIQGITEDTAGALEAITNGISQQCYLQSDLLTQIRDAVVGFDIDVQVSVMSQMLLQLQSSYQVQQSILTTMQGWSNASGMAMRVEMI